MARLLLDTHVLLRVLSEPESLDPAARTAVEAPSNEVFVSAASGWEIALKRTLGMLEAPPMPESGLRKLGFKLLAITFGHAERAGELPLHHRDPFDRMLIAQAQFEGLTLVTRDARIPIYDVATLAA